MRASGVGDAAVRRLVHDPDLPPCFSSTPHVLDHHAAVDRLDHVVDGQQAHLDGRQGLHLDAGAAQRLGLHGAVHGARGGVERELDAARASAAAGGTAGPARTVRLAAWIAAMRATPSTSPFFALPPAMAASVAGCMRIVPVARATRRVSGLRADVDHVGLALGVEVGQAGGGTEAVESFMEPWAGGGRSELGGGDSGSDSRALHGRYTAVSS